MPNRLPKRVKIVTMAVILWATQGMTAAREGAAPPGETVPKETAVLLLPALDTTADTANMQSPRRAVIRHREQAEFIKRQFKVLGETLALQAADIAPRVDLANASVRSAENLDALAERAQADWAVNTIVEDVVMTSAEGGEFKASTRLLLQIRDARQHRWIINHSFIGRADGNGAPPMIFMHSLDNAVKGALADPLGAFPEVIILELDGNLVDYLEGQVEPFVGDPQKPFAGLKADNKPPVD